MLSKDLGIGIPFTLGDQQEQNPKTKYKLSNNEVRKMLTKHIWCTTLHQFMIPGLIIYVDKFKTLDLLDSIILSRSCPQTNLEI